MKKEMTENGPLQHWSPKEVADAHDTNTVVLIDVRTPQEYSFERIGGALLLPMQEFDPAYLPEPDGNKTIVFHCGSGVRSRKMAERALASGWPGSAHMEGGFAAWKEAGLPYIGTDMATGAPKKMRKDG